MQLESTTYHYAMSPEAGEWPDLTKRYSKTTVYRPDYLSFDIHVTHETHRVSVQNISISGFRILKDNTFSSHRVRENLFGSEMPAFVAKRLAEARAKHGA